MGVAVAAVASIARETRLPWHRLGRATHRHGGKRIGQRRCRAAGVQHLAHTHPLGHQYVAHHAAGHFQLHAVGDLAGGAAADLCLCDIDARTLQRERLERRKTGHQPGQRHRRGRLRRQRVSGPQLNRREHVAGGCVGGAHVQRHAIGQRGRVQAVAEDRLRVVDLQVTQAELARGRVERLHLAPQHRRRRLRRQRLHAGRAHGTTGCRQCVNLHVLPWLQGSHVRHAGEHRGGVHRDRHTHHAEATLRRVHRVQAAAQLGRGQHVARGAGAQGRVHRAAHLHRHPQLQPLGVGGLDAGRADVETHAVDHHAARVVGTVHARHAADSHRQQRDAGATGPHPLAAPTAGQAPAQRKRRGQRTDAVPSVHVFSFWRSGPGGVVGALCPGDTLSW
jgi:hypothetical protein